MKIAITAQGPTMQSSVDPRFGRAKYFVVVDTDTGACKAVHNVQNIEAAQGAGIQAAAKMDELGVDALITGNVGPKAFATLKAARIDVYIGASGAVEDALKQYKEGALQRAEGANVESHWM